MGLGVDVDNFEENSNENSRLYLNTCRIGCVLALLSVFSSLFFLFCFVVVAAVLEGVHFSFGSRPDPILLQVFILVQSAVLWIFHKQHFFFFFLNKGTCFFHCFVLSF